MAWPEDAVQALNPVRRKSDTRWFCRCPAHGDRNPSLQVDLVRMRDGGGQALLLLCRAGCKFHDIVRAAGLDMTKDLFQRTEHGWDTGRKKPRFAKAYDYLGPDGELRYQKVRYEPKEFRQRRPDGHGGWLWDMEGVQRVLYRLPELLASTGPVLLLEGEKDADCARGFGLAATTATEGAGAGWDSALYPSMLAGRDVAVVPDEDRAGLEHARRVMGACLMFGGPASVRLVRLPFPAGKPGKDFADWAGIVGRRMAARRMQELIERTPCWRTGA